MAENLYIPETGNREDIYAALLPQISALLSGEHDRIANLANVTAVLKEAFGFFWVGFYLVQGDELVLGPFQGTLACTRIRKGKGVCGTAFERAETILVSDVNAFPGHIACSSVSKSEIVVPVFKEGAVVAVLDVDSEWPANFSQTDRNYLEKICELVAKTF